MPTASKVPCKYPSCGRAVDRKVGYCDKHLKVNTARRGSAASQGYDAQWRRLRQWHLASHPTCVECAKEGIVTAATIVDHIVSFRHRPELRLDADAIQSLCPMHHNQKTARENGFGGSNE